MLYERVTGRPWIAGRRGSSRKSKASIDWRSRRKTSRKCLPTANTNCTTLISLSQEKRVRFIDAVPWSTFAEAPISRTLERSRPSRSCRYEHDPAGAVLPSLLLIAISRTLPHISLVTRITTLYNVFVVLLSPIRSRCRNI